MAGKAKKIVSRWRTNAVPPEHLNLSKLEFKVLRHFYDCTTMYDRGLIFELGIEPKELVAIVENLVQKRLIREKREKPDEFLLQYGALPLFESHYEIYSKVLTATSEFHNNNMGAVEIWRYCACASWYNKGLVAGCLWDLKLQGLVALDEESDSNTYKRFINSARLTELGKLVVAYLEK